MAPEAQDAAADAITLSRSNKTNNASLSIPSNTNCVIPADREDLGTVSAHLSIVANIESRFGDIEID